MTVHCHPERSEGSALVVPKCRSLVASLLGMTEECRSLGASLLGMTGRPVAPQNAGHGTILRLTPIDHSLGVARDRIALDGVVERAVGHERDHLGEWLARGADLQLEPAVHLVERDNLE